MRAALAFLFSLLTLSVVQAQRTPSATNGCQYFASFTALSDKQTTVFRCDANGNFLISGTFSPSGTQNVNITQVLGAAPSVSNPLFTAGAELPDASGTFTNATQTTSVTTVSMDGYGSAFVSINGTYGTATAVFEMSDDAGTTWYSVQGVRSDGTAAETGYTTLTNTTRGWWISVGAGDMLRVRSTAVASGTVNVRISISSVVNPNANPGILAALQAGIIVVGNVASGAADSGNPVKVGGVYNTTPPTLTNQQRVDLQFDSRGNVQTTLLAPGTASPIASVTNNTDGVGVSALLTHLQTASLGYLFNGTTFDRVRSINGAVAAGTGTAAVAIAPTSAATGGITPVVSASAENSHVLKNAAGNLYTAYATNLTATAGFLVVLNATSAPADGAITPLDCVPLPANGNATINYGAGPPAVYGTGIVAVVTSANTCFTKTTGVITAFIKGGVQ